MFVHEFPKTQLAPDRDPADQISIPPDSTGTLTSDSSPGLGSQSLNPTPPLEVLSSERSSSSFGRYIPPIAMKFFPSFMFDVNDAIRDQDLNPMQIRELIHKYLDDTEKLYLAEPRRVQYQTTAGDAGDLNVPAQISGTDAAQSSGAPVLTSGSPGVNATKTAATEDINTSTNTNADTNVLEWNGNPDQIVGIQGSTEGAQTVIMLLVFT